MKNKKLEAEKQREDFGFGTKAISKNARLVRDDGNFNVKKIGQTLAAKLNIYHSLIVMPWYKFLIVVLSFYFFVNLIFGEIYYLLGTESLNGYDPSSNISDFWQAFFFSAQTLTTVGYGQMNPATYPSHFVSAIEALVGLMSFAIMTGLLYGRFSRPLPRIVFSENALISPYLDINGLMIRMANERSNQLINVSASVIFSRNEMVNGEMKRKYYNLELERAVVKYFAMSWTIVHPITPESILYNETAESLIESNGEFLLAIEATNDTLTDPVHARKSYLANSLVFGGAFESMMEEEENYYKLDLEKIGAYNFKPLNG